MYYCKTEKCIHKQLQRRECLHRSGRGCENKVYGCPKCHGTTHQELSGEFSFMVCDKCGYTEFDD